MEQYLGALIAAGFGVILLSTLLLLAKFLPPGPRKGARTAHDESKEDVYECGVPPTGGAHRRFSVKFFLVAMLFVVFDVEAVLILPWAVTYPKLGVFGFIEMLVFLGVLSVGLAYIWKKGALEW